MTHDMTHHLTHDMNGNALKEMLVRGALVSREYIGWAVETTDGMTCTWLEKLLLVGALDEEAVCRCIGDVARVPRCDPEMLRDLTPSALASVPSEVAVEHRLLPLGVDHEGYVHLVMVDPTDSAALEEVAFFSGRSVMRQIAVAGLIAWGLHHYYGARTVLWPRPPTH